MVEATFAAIALAVLVVAGLVVRRVVVDMRVARGRSAAATAGDPAPRTAFMAPLLFGFGAGLAFLIAFVAAPVAEDERIFFATAVYMAAAAVLSLAYRLPRRMLWPLPWSTLLVLAMGALALWSRDERWIKVRPTLMFSVAATFAALTLATRHPRLEALFPADRIGFDAAGRRKLLAMLAAFGATMALLNELVWRNASDLFWIGYQLWGPLAGFAIFAMLGIRMLEPHMTRHSEARAAK